MAHFEEDLDVCDSFRASLSDNDHVRLKIMDRVRAKYIRSDRDAELEHLLKFLIERMVASGDPNEPPSKAFRREGRSIVVMGGSGAGKTTSLDRLFRRHSAFPGYGEQGSGCPLVTVNVNGPCTLGQLGRQVLAELGYPLVAERKEHIIWEMARAKIESLGVRILHFDEVQNVTSNADVKAAARITGLPEVMPFLREDFQNVRRSRFIEFKALSYQDVTRIKKIVVALAGVAELSISQDVVEEVAPRLMHAATRQMGIAIEIIHQAIDNALSCGANCLTEEHFATVYAQRTGNAAPANPFVASNWHEIDCGKTLLEKINPMEASSATPLPAPKRKSRKPVKYTKRGM